jgi:hypothetical protein
METTGKVRFDDPRVDLLADLHTGTPQEVGFERVRIPLR